jgi:AraC-like DNA-binding protein
MSRSRQAGIRALSYDYESGHRVPPRAHPEDQLLFAAAGVMTVTTPDGTWIVPPNRGVWVPEGVEHSIRMSGAVAMRTLYLPPHLGRSILPARCTVLEMSPLLREVVLAAVARGGLDRRKRRDASLFAVLADELRALPTRALHLPYPRDPRALRIASRIEREPADVARGDALVRGSGASRRTIERLFRTETGMSLGAWRRQLRLGRALERLGAGEAVTAVALECGWSSTSAFVAAFRAAFAETPGRYFR